MMMEFMGLTLLSLFISETHTLCFLTVVRHSVCEYMYMKLMNEMNI